jgi:chaperone BCS1
MTMMPARSILLLEDADAAFNKREQSSEKGFVSGVTFSGLLNALDGVAAAEERLIFMTTNHIDRLDPALIRPGRVDVKVLLDWPTTSQIRDLFVKFYDRPDLADSFLDSLGIEFSNTAITDEHKWHSNGLSMAALQGHFIRFREDPLAAVENVRCLRSDH